MKIEHNHEHHEKATGNLLFVFILNITFNVIVILGGLITNSVAILADCLHDLSDTISIGLAGVLEHVSQKNPNENYTYGYQRFSILGAVITSIFVIIVSVVVVYESISRLLCPVAPEAGWMLLVAIVGIIFKGVSVFKLHKGETINEKVILFHLLGDVFGWIAILVISVILMFWNVSFLDPLLSLIISLWLLYNMGKALHESVCVLLQKSPKNVDVDEIKSQIEGLNHINNVLDIHLWSLDGIDSILTLKINIDDVNNGDDVKKEIYTIASKYHIVDTTVDILSHTYQMHSTSNNIKREK